MQIEIVQAATVFHLLGHPHWCSGKHRGFEINDTQPQLQLSKLKTNKQKKTGKERTSIMTIIDIIFHLFLLFRHIQALPLVPLGF